MAFSLSTTEQYDDSDHHYRIYEPAEDTDWQEALAEQYLLLRTQTLLAIQSVNLEDIEVFETDEIQRVLNEASIPKLTRGPLNIIRSDMGEVLSYLVLEQEHHTRICLKPVSFRERVDLPARGVDCFGFEEGESLTLIINEVKVSGEDRHPPQVVESGSDSLKAQHFNHLNNPRELRNKLMTAARFTIDKDSQELLIGAAMMIQVHGIDSINVVCSSFLVRPKSVAHVTDFGIFRQAAAYFHPGKIRFIIFCLPSDVDSFVEQWYQRVTRRING